MLLERMTPHLGIRVSGVDLAHLAPAGASEVRALVEEHLAVFFVGQHLPPEGFLRVGKLLGELEPPEVSAPYQPTLDGELGEINYLEVDDAIERGTYSDQWHSDGSYFECPSYAALLQPAILPSLGGDTLWSSMYAAYEALADSVRRDLEGLSALHSAGTQGEFVHPVIRVHPETGRRGLFVNPLFVKRIVGLGERESAELIESLFRHLVSPEFQIRFRWTSDVVAVWDNRFSMHFAVRDYSERRRMLRLSLAGERPVGP